MSSTSTAFEWLGIDSPSAPDTILMERVVAAVSETILARVSFEGDTPAAVQQAIDMTAARYWKRRSTPEGVMAFDDIGVIRVSRLDGDVEHLLAPFIVWNFA